MNQIILVGRLVKTPEVVTTESGKNMSYITLAIPRSFKNMNGEYDTDFVDCILWENTAKSTSEYCKKGDIIGIKGRIQSRIVEKDDEKKYLIEIIAEKVTFLSSTSNNKTDE